MVFYFIVVWLLSSLRSFHRELEATVRQRTQALTQEMAERQRLEEEILRVSERERRSIGHDLHDSLCQHLTGTALAGQVLGERLAAKSLPEAADAEKVVGLVEEGITLARNLARGLYPVDVEAGGLMDAFQEPGSERHPRGAGPMRLRVWRTRPYPRRRCGHAPLPHRARSGPQCPPARQTQARRHHFS